LNHAGWRISGAQPGDVVLVSGELGGSLLGKHLDFTPRCQLAAEIAGRYSVHAATDISDSLSLDLNEIALQSNLGITIEADSIPLAAAAKQRSAGSGRTPLEHALYDGEDFELLLTVAPDTAKAMLRDKTLSASLSEIGHVRAEPGELLMTRGSKAPEPLPVKGYEH
jgi:thiamine-monophosphate kinase